MLGKVARSVFRMFNVNFLLGSLASEFESFTPSINQLFSSKFILLPLFISLQILTFHVYDFFFYQFCDFLLSILIATALNDILLISGKGIL